MTKVMVDDTARMGRHEDVKCWVAQQGPLAGVCDYGKIVHMQYVYNSKPSNKL